MNIVEKLDFKVEKEKIWLSFPAIVEAGIPENTAKDGLKKYRDVDSNLWEHKNDDKDKRRVWILFDKLPELQRQRVNKHYGDIVELAAVQTIKKEVTDLVEFRDMDFFLNQKLRKDGAAYTNQQAAQLTQACAWLRWLDKAAKERLWKDKLQVKTGVFIDKTGDFYGFIAQILKNEAIYGFKINNGNYLYQKLAQWREIEKNSLLDGRFGNDNPTKIKEADMDFAIVHYAQNKKTVPQIVELLAQNRDTKVTRQALGKRLFAPNIEQVWKPIREGHLAAQKESWSYVKNAKAPFADALWLVDGTQIALFYQEGSQAKKSTWNVVFVRDHNTRCVIGLAFGQTETTELVRLAMRRAVAFKGKLPYSIRYDGGSANTSAIMKEVFTKLSVYHFKTMPYHQGGKADVERLVNEVENILKTGFDNFAGGNITRRGTEKDFNTDTVKRMLKSGLMPNNHEVLIQYWAAVEVVNHRIGKDGKSPAEKYAQCNDVRRRNATIEIMAAAFWEKRPQSVRYEGGGLRIEIGGKRLEYWVGEPMVESYEFKRKNEGKSFYYRLDAEQNGRIALYTEDDAFVAEAVLKHEFSLIAEFAQEGEQSKLRQHIQNQNRFLTEGVAEYKEAVKRVEERGEPTKFDFLELNKEALADSEAGVKERLLDMLQNTTERRGKKQIETPKMLSQNSEIIEDNNNDFDIFKIYGQ
jgi:transposase InsO family protein